MAEEQSSKGNSTTSLSDLKTQAHAADVAPHRSLSMDQVNDLNRTLEQARGIVGVVIDACHKEDARLSAAMWAARELIEQAMDVIDPPNDGPRYRPDAWRDTVSRWERGQ
jgi:putative N-acetylmannosamine-6-phosphate epimerase